MVSFFYDERMKIVPTLFVAVLLIPVFAAYAEHHEKKKETDPSIPPVVTPGVHGTPDQAGTPPSDALVLFDGKNFDHWESGKGGEVKWKIVDGAMEVVRGTGTIQTKKKLGYGQYHVEWRTPEVVKGSGQGPLPKNVALVKKPPRVKRAKPVRMVPLVRRAPTVRRNPFVRAVPKRR